MDVANVAVMMLENGEDTSAPVPRGTAPSKSVTVPVAMQQGETVTVKVTA